MVVDCAKQIRDARERVKPLWFIPYRRFYRLNPEGTYRLIASDPAHSLQFTDPLQKSFQDTHDHGAVSSGHHWGALIQIMPREAFLAVGGMDEGFRGWGSEDVSHMYAVDTLYGRHRTYNAPVYHLWHPTTQGSYKGTKQWEDQPKTEMNNVLAAKYVRALGNREEMRKLRGLPE